MKLSYILTYIVHHGDFVTKQFCLVQVVGGQYDDTTLFVFHYQFPNEASSYRVNAWNNLIII